MIVKLIHKDNSETIHDDISQTVTLDDHMRWKASEPYDAPQWFFETNDKGSPYSLQPILSTQTRMHTFTTGMGYKPHFATIPYDKRVAETPEQAREAYVTENDLSSTGYAWRIR